MASALGCATNVTVPPAPCTRTSRWDAPGRRIWLAVVVRVRRVPGSAMSVPDDANQDGVTDPAPRPDPCADVVRCCPLLRTPAENHLEMSRTNVCFDVRPVDAGQSGT